MLKSISKSTGVPAATLEKQKAKTGLSYGDIFAAHSIAKASGKSFDQIAALKAKGQSWDKIADANNVSLGGQESDENTPPAATASPTPAPKNSDPGTARPLDSGPHQVTNAPRTCRRAKRSRLNSALATLLGGEERRKFQRRREKSCFR